MKKIITLTLIILALAAINAPARAATRKSDTRLKVRITSPSPGATVSGTIEILWEITNANPDAVYQVSYYVDTKYVGATTNESTPFKLDTTQYENGKHLLTINVTDNDNRIGTYSLWVKVVNEE